MIVIIATLAFAGIIGAVGLTAAIHGSRQINHTPPKNHGQGKLFAPSRR